MDLYQRKLTKTEWNSIEVPVSGNEKEILKLIVDGYDNVNIRYNKHSSLMGILKLTYSEGIEDYLYKTYLECEVLELQKKNSEYNNLIKVNVTDKPKINKGELIRIGANDVKKLRAAGSFEYVLIDLVKLLLNNKKKNKKEWVIQYFTLHKFKTLTISNINRHVKSLVQGILDAFEEHVPMIDVIERGVEMIEKNAELLKYDDNRLYQHQRHIYTNSRFPTSIPVTSIPKLIEGAQSLGFSKNKNLMLRVKKRQGGYEISKVEWHHEKQEHADDIDNEIEEYEEYEGYAHLVCVYMCLINNPLYEREIQIMNEMVPNLSLYIAPTGTGKTLTPLGLSNEFRIIFVCAARHVGLALAKSAISMNKKIAFAFGCESADDIRLHYFAAKEYSLNKRTGGIGKVDNSIGDKVEIMICDIKSYLPAMYYMLSFNSAYNIITYWDEPTIAMDYEEHDLHAIINKNWCENKIPNVILSSATLPKQEELNETIASFRSLTSNRAVIHNIVSHDCKKSIPILSKSGRVVLPHHLSEDFDEIKDIVRHCENNLTLLRYFDLKEVIEFIIYVEKSDYISSRFHISRHFTCIDDIDMQTIKLHYLRVLKNVKQGMWGAAAMHFKQVNRTRIVYNDQVDLKGVSMRKTNSIGPGTTSKFASMPNDVYSPSSGGGALVRQQSHQPMSPSLKPPATDTNTVIPERQPGIYITTKDAFTLTDGPTIFLADNVEKVAKFCIQQANIPSNVMTDIINKIEFNNKVNQKMDTIEKQLEDLEERNTMKGSNGDDGKGRGKSKKDTQAKSMKGSDARLQRDMQQELETLRGIIKTARLNDTFIPNKLEHFNKWASTMPNENIFTSDIDDGTIVEIMSLSNVSDSWKILLLMGIGVFTNHKSIAYTEIMKKMADEQRLYVIIASSDYIYGTNYQFCHGYLSKDLTLTQEKTIQALGRIGRNNIQQNYTVRLRDDSQINKLFYHEDNKIEVRKMNYLFNDNNRLYETD